jgi:hypothetical protein
VKEVPNGVPIVAAGPGGGWPQVEGFCPACGSRSLFLGSGGYVTCSIIRCPNPSAVSDQLENREPPPRLRTETRVFVKGKGWKANPINNDVVVSKQERQVTGWRFISRTADERDMAIAAEVER